MSTDQTTSSVKRGRPPKVKTVNLLDGPAFAQQEDCQDGQSAPRENKQPDEPREDPRAFPPPTEISEKLFEENVRLAFMIARRWAVKTRMPFETLKSLAMLGLLRAARKYNPNLINPKNGKPYALSSHSVPFIVGEIKHFLRKNHASGVTFPEQWRDNAPRVKKLLSQGLTPEQAGEKTGFTAHEVREIIEAQSSTQELDLDARGHAYYDPELTDDEIDSSELIEALQIADQAWIALDWSLQQIMLQSWDGYGRRNRQELATRPYDRFAKLARAITSGHSLPRGIRQPALDLVITDNEGKAQSLSKPSDITSALEQMALEINN